MGSVILTSSGYYVLDSALQACRIVVFATLFLSAACPEAAGFLATAGECRLRRNQNPVRFCQRTGSLRFGTHLHDLRFSSLSSSPSPGNLRNLCNLWMVLNEFLVSGSWFQVPCPSSEPSALAATAPVRQCICGSIGFGSGLRGRAMVNSVSVSGDASFRAERQRRAEAHPSLCPVYCLLSTTGSRPASASRQSRRW
jgi:hypothetical protein